jgi:hypothetical protein
MYLAPIEAWPRHPRPQARAALEEARDAGWWFEHSTKGHAFGRLRCKPPDLDPDRDGCTMMVLSTSGSADGSDTARFVRDAIRKCPHDLSAPAQALTPPAAARRGSGRLAQVAALVEAAERLITAHSTAEEAGVMLEDALRELDHGLATDELERRIGELERKAEDEGYRARAAALRAEAADPWPPKEGARELVGLARNILDETQDLIAAAGGSGEEAHLAAELDSLSTRLDRVSSLLDS